MKVHHSVTDGVGGIDLLTQLVDFERDADEPDALAEPPAAGQALDAFALLRDSLDHTTRRWLGISRRMPAMLGEAVVTTARAPLRAAAERDRHRPLDRAHARAGDRAACRRCS